MMNPYILKLAKYRIW